MRNRQAPERDPAPARELWSEEARLTSLDVQALGEQLEELAEAADVPL